MRKILKIIASIIKSVIIDEVIHFILLSIRHFSKFIHFILQFCYYLFFYYVYSYSCCCLYSHLNYFYLTHFYHVEIFYLLMLILFYLNFVLYFVILDLFSSDNLVIQIFYSGYLKALS